MLFVDKTSINLIIHGRLKLKLVHENKIPWINKADSYICHENVSTSDGKS